MQNDQIESEVTEVIEAAAEEFEFETLREFGHM